jgi:hypothetical protein
MEDDNLQASNPIELYNVDTVEQPIIKEEVDSIPKVEIPEEAKSEIGFDEMGNVIGTIDKLNYENPKIETKEIQIPTPGERGKLATFFLGPDINIQGDFSMPIGKTFERIGKAAFGEKLEPREGDYNYIEQASSALIHASIAVPHNAFSLAAEIGDFVRGNGVPVEDRYITKLEDIINGSFIGRIEKESKDIAYTGAVGMLTDGIAQLYSAGKIGDLIVSKPLNALRISKMAEEYVAASKANKLISPSTNLGRAADKAVQLNNLSGKDKFISIAIGGAGIGAGAALVANSEDIGTFGDLLKQEFGINAPTAIDRFKKEESADEAARRLYNRFKFGGENTLITFPFAYGAGVVQEIAKSGKEIAFSNNAFTRWIDKYIAAPFRARGSKSEQLFEGIKTVEAQEASVKVTAKDLLIDIDQSLGKIAKESEISISNPAFKKIIDKLDELLVAGNDVIQSGKLTFKGFKSQELNSFKEFAKEIGINPNQINSLTSELIKVRNQFNVIKNNILNSKNLQIGASEFNKIMSERMRNLFTTEYKIMADRSIVPFLNYKPSDSDIQATKGIIARYAKGNGKILNANKLDDIMNDIISNIKYDDVTKTPKFIIGEQSALSDGATQMINIADNIKGGKFKATEFVKKPQDLKTLQKLFGEKRDIRNTIVNTMTDLTSISAKDDFYNNMLKASDQAIKNGERAIVYPTYNDAVANLKNRPIIKGKNGLQIESPLGDSVYANPLNGKFTSEEFADALKFNEKMFLDPLVKQGWYQHLVLVPKGAFQISKTILGPFSHTRNFVSNTVFTGAQGNFFLNPAEIAKDFKYSWNLVQPQLLYRNTPKDQQLYKFLTEQNVMGSSANAKDLHGLLDDMGKGGDFYSRLTTKFNDALKRNFPMAGQATEATTKGIKRGYQVATDLYMAEDEFWKGYNFFAEWYKYKNAYADAVKSGLIKKMPDELSIMKETAKIVRDTLPNYGFVPDFIKSLRRIPMGNFISWPAQIISTSASTLELGYKEAMNPITRNIGLKRLASFAGMTTLAVPTINAIGRGLYGITQDQVAAVREFAPVFSKDSSLFVYKDKEGNLKYIDATGTFVYDTVTNPAQSVLNGIEKERVFNPGSPLMVGAYKGLVNGMARLMKPFIEPSAYVTMALDLWARGGKTADGHQIWNPEASLGEKFNKGLGYIAKQYAPFSIPQFQRLGQAALGIPGERGEKYEISDEIGGFYGLRGIPVKPEEKMDFKINEFKTGIKNTKGLFASEVLKGGEISKDDIIQRYIEANKQRYAVMNKIKQINDAASLLGMDDKALAKKFAERQESNAYGYIKNNKFYPFDITTEVGQKFKQQREKLESEFDQLKFEAPYDKDTSKVINELQKIMRQIPLNDNFDSYINPKDWIIEGNRSEAPATSKTAALPPQPSPNAQVVQPSPQVNQDILPNGLTKTETALLKPEEQLMRLNQRQAGPQQTGQV